MSIVRLHSCGALLAAPTAEGGTTPGTVPDFLDRPARFVYAGEFESVDGPVTVSPDDVNRMITHHNSFVARLSRGLTGPPPVRSMQPVQLDHSRLAVHTVGRVVGALQPGTFEAPDGTKRFAADGTVRIMGKENVEKVLDGRWNDLSVGVDFATGKLSELSITPFPAAEGSALLAAGKEGASHMSLKHHLKGYAHHMEGLAEHYGMEKSMAKHLAEIADHKEGDDHAKHFDGMAKHFESMAKKHLEGVPHQGKEEGQHDEAQEKMRKHHLEGMGHHLEGMKRHTIGEHHVHLDAMKAHMASMAEYKPAHEGDGKPAGEGAPGAKVEAAAAEPPKPPVQAAEPPAPAPKAADPKAEPGTEQKMSAALKEGLTKLAATAEPLRLAKRKAVLSVRLSRLKSDAKITPAEVKKIDLVALAKDTDATIEAVFKSYESREPVILAGMMGSTKAEDLSATAKELRMSRMEHEARLNMPLKAAELKAQQAAGVKAVENPAAESASPKVELSVSEDNLVKLMESGKIDDAKELVKKLFQDVKTRLAAAPAHADDALAELSALATEVDQVQNQINDLMKLSG